MNIIDKINKEQKNLLLQKRKELFDQLGEKYKKNVDLNYKPLVGHKVELYNMVEKKGKLCCYKIISGMICKNKNHIKIFEQEKKNGEYVFLYVNRNCPTIFIKPINVRYTKKRAVLNIKHLMRV